MIDQINAGRLRQIAELDRQLKFVKNPTTRSQLLRLRDTFKSDIKYSTSRLRLAAERVRALPMSQRVYQKGAPFGNTVASKKRLTVIRKGR